MKKLSSPLRSALMFLSRGERIPYSIAKTLEIKGLVERSSDAGLPWQLSKRGREALKTEKD